MSRYITPLELALLAEYYIEKGDLLRAQKYQNECEREEMEQDQDQDQDQ